MARRRSVKLGAQTKRIEAAYVRDLRRVWRAAQEIFLIGIEPLLDVWAQNEGEIATDARDPRYEELLRRAQEARRGEQIRLRNIRQPTKLTGSTEETSVASASLFDPPKAPNIKSMTDAQLRELWPNTDPADVRKYAPWATRRSEVARLAFRAGDIPTVSQLERALQNAITTKRREENARIRTDRPEIKGSRRQIPMLFDGHGNPMMPPNHRTLTTAAINQTMKWINDATQFSLDKAELDSILSRRSMQADNAAVRTLARELAINPRIGGDAIPAHINMWRNRNIQLIETGVMAPYLTPQFRPGLLGDLSHMVEQSHQRGVRVEDLMENIKERFGANDWRSELIARDQILKLNGQISKHRQESVGIKQYKWITSNDERVRDRHADLHGTIQSWDNPPIIDDKGRTGHPGDDYQCRCTASPVLPDYLAVGSLSRAKTTPKDGLNHVSGDGLPQNLQNQVVQALKDPDKLDVNPWGMRDLGLFQRTLKGLNRAGVNEITTKMSKAPFDRPIEIKVNPGGQTSLSDGRHRLQAAREAGATHIKAQIFTYNDNGDLISTTTAVVPTGGNPYRIVQSEEEGRYLRRR